MPTEVTVLAIVPEVSSPFDVATVTPIVEPSFIEILKAFIPSWI